MKFQDFVDFGVKSGLSGSREVSEWLRIEILLQMGFRRACYDHPRPKQAPGQCPLPCLNLQSVAKSDIGLLDTEDIALVETQDVALFETQDIALVETQDIALVETQDIPLVEARDIALLEQNQKVLLM